jgi:hypothetical protein
MGADGCTVYVQILPIDKISDRMTYFLPDSFAAPPIEAFKDTVPLAVSTRPRIAMLTSRLS